MKVLISWACFLVSATAFHTIRQSQIVIRNWSRFASTRPTTVPSTAEKCKTILSVVNKGVLSVVGGANGEHSTATTTTTPSIVPFSFDAEFVLDNSGKPHFVAHSNQQEPVGRIAAGDLLSLKVDFPTFSREFNRVVMLGKSVEISSEERALIRPHLVGRHSHLSELTAEGSNYSILKLSPTAVFLCSSNSSLSVPVDDFLQAEADVLGKEASNIIKKLNLEKRPQFKQFCTHWFGIKPEKFVNAEFIQADRFGLELEVDENVQNGVIEEIRRISHRIGFCQRARTADEAKSEIFKLFLESDAAGRLTSLPPSGTS